MKKRYFLYLFTLILALFLPTSVLADHDLTSGNFVCEIDDGEVQIEDYFGSESTVTIPNVIEGMRVTEIGDDCFKNNQSLNKVIVSEGIEKIEEDAFSNCPNLREIQIPASVRKIDREAFKRSEQVTIIAPNGSTAQRFASSMGLNFQSNGAGTSPAPSTGVRVRSVKVLNDDVTLNIGQTFQLQWMIQPSNATNQNVRFVSKNPAVANVSGSGLVTAVGTGKVEVEVISEDGAHDDDCDIRVLGNGSQTVTPNNPGSTNVRDIKLNKERLNLKPGETFQLNVSFSPSTASDTISWTSTNPAVATVDSKGTVTAVANGRAEIIARTSDRRHDDDCDVIVGTGSTNNNSNNVSVRDIHLDRERLTLSIGQETQLKATVEPANATDKTLVWESSNNSVATVSQTGVVTAKQDGSAIITVKTKDNRETEKCRVTVGKSSNSVSSVKATKLTVSPTSKSKQLHYKREN